MSAIGRLLCRLRDAVRRVREELHKPCAECERLRLLGQGECADCYADRQW